jgi:hypothetical protein
LVREHEHSPFPCESKVRRQTAGRLVVPVGRVLVSDTV